MLLKKDRGRIDLHLAVLFTVEVVFRKGAGVVAAATRPFAAFGVQEKVRELFCINFDPLKVHCHLMNVANANAGHVSIFVDGRAEYENGLGIKLPQAFVSNASDNICFLDTDPAHKAQSGALPDMPSWTLRGSFTNEQVDDLENYRHCARGARLEVESALSPVGDILQFLAPLLAFAGGAGSSLTSCTGMHVAGSKQQTVAHEAAALSHGRVDRVSPLGVSSIGHPTQSSLVQATLPMPRPDEREVPLPPRMQARFAGTYHPTGSMRQGVITITTQTGNQVRVTSTTHRWSPTTASIIGNTMSMSGRTGTLSNGHIAWADGETWILEAKASDEAHGKSSSEA
jgi:hypothetical protein